MTSVISMDKDVRRVYQRLFSELDTTILRIQTAQSKIAEIETMVFDVVLTELKTGKISGYNASTAYANLVNSVCKLERLKLEIVDRISGAGPLTESEAESKTDTQQNRELQELTELLLTHAVRKKVESAAGRKLHAVTSSGA